MSLLGFAIFSSFGASKFCILASGRTRSNEVLLNYHPFGLVWSSFFPSADRLGASNSFKIFQ